MGRKHFVRFKRSRFDRQLIDTYTYEQIISHGQPAMRTTRGRTPVSVRAEDLYYGTLRLLWQAADRHQLALDER